MSSELPKPKYSKPKILVIDMSEECVQVLRDAGYNVTVGTFGAPYTVPRSGKGHLVTCESCSLPNAEEQEIIIAYTGTPKGEAKPPQEGPGPGANGIWQEALRGCIDPRPLFMGFHREIFQRILDHGGIFIVIVSERYSVEYIHGKQEYNGVHEEKRFIWTNWSFLEVLDSFNAPRRNGTEIDFEKNSVGKLLKRGSNAASYECALAPHWQNEEKWTPIAKNKYGDAVGGVIFDENKGGGVFVLPQMPDIHTVLIRLLEEWCTLLNPALFPEHEGSKWMRRKEYEIPEVNRLREQIEAVRKNAHETVKSLEQKIADVQAANSDWYTLLNGTGDTLVAAVIRSLQFLGFQKVVDVDKEVREKNESASLREDIQIRDQQPVLIVDVKGVNGHPEDDEATQAVKHALMRARELNGQVQPLTIINHQRSLPPHDRDQQAYRTEIIGNAQQTGLGLMTTWDLFRLLRNKENLGWPPEVVRPIFYRTGRIDPIPEHYVEVGRVEHVWQDAFRLIPVLRVARGVTIAIENGDSFEESVVTSLQVNGASTEGVDPGITCGIGYEGVEDRLRAGMRVFLVTTRNSGDTQPIIDAIDGIG